MKLWQCLDCLPKEKYFRSAEGYETHATTAHKRRQMKLNRHYKIVYTKKPQNELVKRLEDDFTDFLKSADYKDAKGCFDFQRKHGMKGMEIFFCPEKDYYNSVLERLEPSDVVFDAGAGDLRFSIMMSRVAEKVYACEINPLILSRALKVIGYDLPANLIPICGNAWKYPLPPDVTAITCLMIHRKHIFPRAWDGKKVIYTNKNGAITRRR